MVANPKLPVKDLREFIALAPRQARRLHLRIFGNGSVNHLLGEMLQMEGGVKILHVPYRGVAQAVTDTIGGQVDTAFSTVPPVLQLIRTGQVRALAISSAKRIAMAPDVPTIAESGFPGFDVNPWWGILAPAKIDMGIVRKINADVAEILKTDAMREFLAAQGAEPDITTPEEFLATLKSDVAKWSKVVKASGVTLN